MAQSTHEEAQRELPPDPYANNELAVRLYLIDMALQHLSRNQGILGLGANAVDQTLRAEKDSIVKQLQRLGEQLEPRDLRRRA
jgi:hypothetical protein